MSSTAIPRSAGGEGIPNNDDSRYPYRKTAPVKEEPYSENGQFQRPDAIGLSEKSMRLSTNELNSIRRSFKKIFGDGCIYLFGSRVDDSQKGGDIDLFLVPVNRENIFEKKIRLLVELDMLIGEQKIDVVIAKDSSRLIEKEAIKNGIKL